MSDFLPMLSPKRKIFLTVIVGVSIAAVVTAVFLPSASIQAWRARRYAERGTVLARGENIEAARTAFLRALALDGNNLSATRELVALMPAADFHNALLLRARLADLDPGDRENLEQMAALALRTNRSDMAAKAIHDLELAEGSTARVLKLRTALALARGDDAGAMTASRRALELDPQNIGARLAAALTEVRSGAATEATERELTSLSANEAARLEALRGLRDLALRQSDRKKAADCAEAVTKLPQAAFADWILHADLTVEGNPARVEELLPVITAKAGTDPRALGSIASWLRKHEHAEAVESWVASTDALKSDATAAQMIRADNLMARSAWAELDTLLAGQKWGNMDFIREAALARAARSSDRVDDSIKHWREATGVAITKLVTARMLVELTNSWPEWNEQTGAFLWRASEHGPEYAVWALPQLQTRAGEKRDTSELLRVTRAMQRLQPNSDPIRNNIAFYSLLLNVSTSTANQIAGELFAKHPTEPAIVSTYALSMLLRDHPTEALAALERLPVTERESAAIAPYYALALAKAGNGVRAAEVVTHAQRDQLLSEEEALLKQARL
jgi:tetratricopeptide (TPR) repeat protein